MTIHHGSEGISGYTARLISQDYPQYRCTDLIRQEARNLWYEDTDVPPGVLACGLPTFDGMKLPRPLSIVC